MAYFCTGVTEMYGPRGPHPFSNTSSTTALATSMEEDGTTLLNSPLGSGRPFDFPSSSFPSLRCFSLNYFSSLTIVIIPGNSVFCCIYKYWRGKFWQITNHLPNPPKISPSKFFPHMVSFLSLEIQAKALLNH